jgi:GAF domain-containing protein
MLERERLATLRSYRILDTPAEPAFDALAQEVALTFRVACAVVSFIDEHRQWYKARVGVDAPQVPRLLSFCAHSIERDLVTVMLDARRDDRFRSHPMVVERGGVRFYAAAPIKAIDRARLGTVCIFDPEPRDRMPHREVVKLADYAGRAMTLLEHRRTTLQTAEARLN